MRRPRRTLVKSNANVARYLSLNPATRDDRESPGSTKARLGDLRVRLRRVGEPAIDHCVELREARRFRDVVIYPGG
jgi:hypothetical protein